MTSCDVRMGVCFGILLKPQEWVGVTTKDDGQEPVRSSSLNLHPDCC